MANIAIPYIFVPGSTILSGQVNANFTECAFIVNGQLDHTNIISGAGILPGQLNLTQVYYNQQLTGNQTWASGKPTDANPSVTMTSDGWLALGPGGSTAPDVIIVRNTAGTVAVRNNTNAADAPLTCGNLTASGSVTASGNVTATGTLSGSGLTLTGSATITGTIALNPTQQLANTALCNGGRLYGTAGSPLSDTTAFSTLLFGPYSHSAAPCDVIALCNSAGTQWTNLSFVEMTAATLSGLTVNAVYDIFAFNNSGVLAFDAPLVWSSLTARATGLQLVNGIYLKAGDKTRRWIGTIYTDSATTTTDTKASRHVFNATNRTARALFAQDTTASWTIAAVNTPGPSNGNTTDGVGRISFVIGLQAEDVSFQNYEYLTDSAISLYSAGVGINSTTTYTCSGESGGNIVAPCSSSYAYQPALGFSYLQRIDSSFNGSNTTTSFYHGSTQPSATGLNALSGTIFN